MKFVALCYISGFGNIMAIFGLLQFWPDFNFYLLSIPLTPAELVSVKHLHILKQPPKY